MAFDLSNYEQVADRLVKFWADHPFGRVETELLMKAAQPGERWVVQAAVYREGEDKPAGMGLAYEIDGEGNVNKTSALENCETSAIGRALANMNYGSKDKERPSREEMSKANPQPDLKCPSCGSKVWDNRETRKGKQPAFRCSNKDCTGYKGGPWASWDENAFDLPQDGQDTHPTEAGPAPAVTTAGSAKAEPKAELGAPSGPASPQPSSEGGTTDAPPASASLPDGTSEITKQDLIQQIRAANKGKAYDGSHVQRLAVRHATAEGVAPPKNAGELHRLSVEALQDIVAKTSAQGALV